MSLPQIQLITHCTADSCYCSVSKARLRAYACSVSRLAYSVSISKAASISKDSLTADSQFDVESAFSVYRDRFAVATSLPNT